MDVYATKLKNRWNFSKTNEAITHPPDKRRPRILWWMFQSNQIAALSYDKVLGVHVKEKLINIIKEFSIRF